MNIIVEALSANSVQWKGGLFAVLAPRARVNYG